MMSKVFKLISLMMLCLSISRFVQSIVLPPFPSVGNLPYQAHSFNDVGYISQLLKRGVKYFKIDVSLANRQSCTRNSDWNQSGKCFKTDQYAEQYCCLALRGDASGRNNFEYPFSTMDNFILMLQEHLKEHAIPKILLFAINQQFDFQFNNELVQNFIYKLAKLMEKYDKLHVGFGSDDFILEYDRICRRAVETQNRSPQSQQPLERLSQQSCGAQRKFISLQRFFLQSGADNPSDTRDYRGRYRNFNVFYQAIIERCESGFPSWIKKYPQFPLIFWEPSNQRQIQLVLEAFMSAKCRRHHGRDLEGLAITSNIDPQVFEFYLKRVNQSISFRPMLFSPDNDKIPLQYAHNFLSKIRMNNSQLLVLGQEGENDPRKGSNLQMIIIRTDDQTNKASQVLRKQLPANNGTVKVLGGQQKVIVVQRSLQIRQSVQIRVLDGNLQRITQANIQRFIDVDQNNGTYYILKQTTNPTIFNILRTTDFDKTAIIVSFSIVLEKAKNVQSFLVVQDILANLRFLVSGSLNNNVWIAQIRNSNIYKIGNVGFGANSKLILKQDGMITVSMENGACSSGVLINNGDTPQCSFYRFPEFRPMTSTKSTVTIIQFQLDSLIQYLQKNTNQPVTPCTPKFVHSKALNGRKVSIVSIWNRLFIASEYVHISDQGILNSLFCAPSNFDVLRNSNKGLLGTITSRYTTGVETHKENPQTQNIFIQSQ